MQLNQHVVPPQSLVFVPLSSDILALAIHLAPDPFPSVVVSVLKDDRPLSVCLAILEVALVY